jgi:hypothetical protein
VSKLLAVIALVVAAGAAGWFLARGSEHAVSLGQPPRAETTTQAAQKTGALPSSRSFAVWFARGGRLVEALRIHKPTRRVATAALDALLAGPTSTERAAGIGTEIPGGTRLLGVVIAGGVARVDLTSDYEKGGGSSSLQLRLAQVVYTATQFPTVKAVRFSVDGAPVDVLPRAVGRDAYRRLAPVAAPLAGSWRPLPAAPMRALASRASAWTGRELLILGRAGNRPVFVSYAPAHRAWRRLPAPRELGRLVWTGHELIAWGAGAAVSAYDPAKQRWRRLPRTSGWQPLASSPLSGSAAWTGHELIVVSDRRAASFAPGRGWRRLPALPEPRPGATAVWDGSELLVVGGNDAPTVGLAYSPADNAWRRLSPMDSGRAHAAAVWTGERLLLWGGETGSPGAFVIPPHGLAYDPKTDRWSPLPQAPLQGRLDPVGAWTGSSLIVWGGDPDFADGAAFTPAG